MYCIYMSWNVQESFISLSHVLDGSATNHCFFSEGFKIYYEVICAYLSESLYINSLVYIHSEMYT